MNYPDGVEIASEKEAEQPPASSQRKREESSTFSIISWMRRFRQLDWADRLNMLLSAILGCALVLILSPLLLVSWIWMQLAKHGSALRRPGT
jgi:hypothetical protein